MFKSKAQVGYMYANHPKLAKEFVSKTPFIKSLPAKVGQADALKRKMK